MEVLAYISLIILLIFGIIYTKNIEAKKKMYIDNYKFPNEISVMLLKIYPNLNNNDIEIIFKGLREYFKLYIDSNRRIIVVPSRLIHRSWNEFTFLTKDYEEFCKNTFGHYVNLSPIGYIKNGIANNDLKITWTLACDAFDIDPTNPNKIPLIFVIDKKFDICDGFKYSIDDIKKIGCLRINKGRA